MAAYYQIVLDRQIGNFRLADGCHPIAAGNLTIANCMHCSIPSSLRNRCIHPNAAPDLSDWRSGVLIHLIVPELIAFRRFADGRIQPDEKLEEIDANPLPSSRSRAALNVLAKWRSRGGDTTDITHCVVFTDVVTGIAREFAGYRYLHRTVPESASILSNSSQQSHRMTAANRLPHFRIGSPSRLSPLHAAQWLRTRHSRLGHQVIAKTAMESTMSFHTERFLAGQDDLRCGTSASQSAAKGVMHEGKTGESP